MLTDNKQQTLKCLFLIITMASLSYAKIPLIGSLNVNQFGPYKMMNETIIGVFFRVVARYEIVFMQEIQGMTGDYVHALMNKVKQETRDKFGYDLTEPLGDDNEQYGFLYRKKHIDYTPMNISEKTANMFRRTPFIGRFALPYNEISEITVIGIHTDSKNVKGEMDALVEIMKELGEKLDEKNFVILGTLNTDCQFCNDDCRKSLKLAKDKSYKWLIADDTTLDDTTCTYDQAIIAGDKLKRLVPDSGSVFQFDKEYSMSERMAKKVTGHYPIEFELKVTVKKPETTKVSGASKLIFQISLTVLSLILLML
ncbi:deoxyribonuclease gamma-like [Argonauta hians]